MDTVPEAKLARKSIYIRGDLHEALARRNRETGVPLQNLIDEALELGVRMKRWSPDAQPLEGSPAA